VGLTGCVDQVEEAKDGEMREGPGGVWGVSAAVCIGKYLWLKGCKGWGHWLEKSKEAQRNQQGMMYILGAKEVRWWRL